MRKTINGVTVPFNNQSGHFRNTIKSGQQCQKSFD